MYWWLSCFYQITCIDDCPASINSHVLMTVLLLSTHMYWWLSCFSQLTYIDVCPASLNSHTLMTVLLLSTPMYWWLSCFSQLPCIDDCPASLNSQELMTVLHLLTHMYWWLSYFYQLTCIDDCPSGELRTQKLKSHMVRTQSLNVLPLKFGVGQYIAIYATLTARNFFLDYFYPSGPFTCIFSKTSPNFFMCWLWLTPDPV